MASAEKALGFYNEANEWFCNAGLPSDLTIVVDGVNFHLHKFPLISRSGKIEKLVKETGNDDKGSCFITLEEIPGGTNGFLMAVKFCYGVPVEFTPRNIVMIYYLADYLEMNDEYGDDNLFSKANNYLNNNVVKNWKDCIVVLQSCVTESDNLEIIDKCLHAISILVCNDPGQLKRRILWNGINTGARIQDLEFEFDWWFDDVAHLRVDFFKRLVRTMEAKSIHPGKLTGAVMYYSGKHIHGLHRWQNGSRSMANITTKNDKNGQKFVLENIIEFLPQTKSKSMCRFLLGLLRVGLILNINNKCQETLEKRIGMQLEFATLDSLMIPSYSDSDTLYNTECVERIINHFFISEQTGKNLSNVSKLVDSYMAEIASDVNLKPEKMLLLAGILPESSRSLNDGLYRALDIYFEAHPWLPEKEKEDICKIIDCQKLSIDACSHVSQSKRLPLRFVLQVLFFEQMHLKRGCLNVVNTEYTLTDPMVIISQRDDWVNLVRENHVLRDGMERMRTRVHELEQEFNKLRQEIKRMSQTLIS